MQDPGHFCPKVGGLNRTVPQNCGILQHFAAKTKHKILIVGDGYGGTQTAPSPRPKAPSKDEQVFKATINRRFHEWCESEELCGAVRVFLTGNRSGSEREGGWWVRLRRSSSRLSPRLDGRLRTVSLALALLQWTGAGVVMGDSRAPSFTTW
jgi:hypothetical protein